MKKILVLMMFCVAAVNLPLYAFHTQRINIYGLHGEARDDLKISLKYLKEGREFTKYDIKREIANLNGLGRYENIAIDVVQSDSANSVINITVTPKFKIKDIKVIGPISKSKIKKHLKLKKKKYFSEGKFLKGIKSVKEYLKSVGYLDSKIDSEVLNETGGIVIRLNVTSGPRYVVKSINYSLKGVSSWRVKWYFRIRKGKHYTLKNIGKGKGKIAKYLEKQGFINSVVDVQYVKKDGGLYFTVKVDAGQKYKISSINFRGVTLLNLKELQKTIPLKKGKYFKKALLRQTLGTVTAMYYEKGYLSASISPDYVFNKDNKTVAVKLVVNEGRRLFLNKINIGGNELTKDYVIRRELLVKPGDVFNYKKVAQSKRKLFQLGFFKKIDIQQYPTAYPDKVDLDINVEEQRTGTMSMGAGWSTVDQLVGYLEVSKKNLFGRAYEDYVKLEFGAKKVHGELGFKNPWLFNTPTPFSFNIYDTLRNVEGQYEENRIGFTTSIGRRIGVFNKIYTGFKYERIKITPITGQTIPEGIESGINTARTITFNLERDLRNSIYHPTDGYHLYMYNELTGGPLGGDNDFYKATMDMSLFSGLFKNLTFANHLYLANIFKIKNETVPDYDRFYLGGPQDIRGYAFRSIHLADGRGGEITYYRGGEASALFNSELRIFFTEGLYGAVFFDMGNLWQDFDHVNLNERPLLFSYGVGFRFDTPVGPLRFDFGWPLEKNRKFSFNDMNIQFSVGELF